MKKTNAVRILDRAKIKYELIKYEYDPEHLSVGKIAKDNQLTTQQVFKTIVAKGDKTGVIVAVISGDDSINLKALAKISGNKKIALFPVKDLLNLTGYIRGGCSPLGMKKQFPVFIETLATTLPKILVNAGQRGLLMKVSTEDLVQVTKGIIAAFAEKKESDN